MRAKSILLAGLLLSACDTAQKDPDAPKMYRAWDNTRQAPVTDWVDTKEEAEAARRKYRKTFPHNQVVIWTQDKPG
jgi:hypothetical protein